MNDTLYITCAICKTGDLSSDDRNFYLPSALDFLIMKKLPLGAQKILFLSTVF